MDSLRHVILTRSAYGPSWTLEANRRRLAMTEGVTIASLRSQTSRAWEWIVLIHRADPLRAQRERAFGQLGARFIYTGTEASPIASAFDAYRAPWAEAIGDRSQKVAMTRLDDDDGFVPWAMERVETTADLTPRRTALMFPLGIRVWQGAFTLVRHGSNAMHTLVTMPGDSMTVYDYGHRDVRKTVPVKVIDRRIAWLWSRHADTISGWRVAERPLVPQIRSMFPIDWSLFDGVHVPQRRTALAAGRCFR